MSDAETTVASRLREAVPAGSLHHLAVLFSGTPHRPLLEALYGYQAEVRRIARFDSHEAAHARLQWWRGEVDRVAAGRAEHPLGRALLPLREHRHADPSLLHETLVAADLDLARFTYRSWQELDAYLYRSAGAMQVLIAAVLAGDDAMATGLREFAARLGAATRQAQMLFDVERDAAAGRVYLPREVLSAAGADPSVLGRHRGDHAATKVLAGWQTRICAQIESLPDLLPDARQRAAQRHGLVLAALHGRWLELWSGPQNARRELGPFVRLWTAWRTALRHR